MRPQGTTTSRCGRPTLASTRSSASGRRSTDSSCPPPPQPPRPRPKAKAPNDSRPRRPPEAAAAAARLPSPHQKPPRPRQAPPPAAPRPATRPMRPRYPATRCRCRSRACLWTWWRSEISRLEPGRRTPRSSTRPVANAAHTHSPEASKRCPASFLAAACGRPTARRCRSAFSRASGPSSPSHHGTASPHSACQADHTGPMHLGDRSYRWGSRAPRGLCSARTVPFSARPGRRADLARAASSCVR